MCKELRLTHLIFADDLMILCKGNIEFVSRVMDALNHFSAVIGLETYMYKSSVFRAGVSDDIKGQIHARIAFFVVSFPITYLGLSQSPKK